MTCGSGHKVDKRTRDNAEMECHCMNGWLGAAGGGVASRLRSDKAEG